MFFTETDPFLPCKRELLAAVLPRGRDAAGMLPGGNDSLTSPLPTLADLFAPRPQYIIFPFVRGTNEYLKSRGHFVPCVAEDSGQVLGVRSDGALMVSTDADMQYWTLVIEGLYPPLDITLSHYKASVPFVLVYSEPSIVPNIVETMTQHYTAGPLPTLRYLPIEYTSYQESEPPFVMTRARRYRRAGARMDYCNPASQPGMEHGFRLRDDPFSFDQTPSLLAISAPWKILPKAFGWLFEPFPVFPRRAQFRCPISTRLRLTPVPSLAPARAGQGYLSTLGRANEQPPNTAETLSERTTTSPQSSVRSGISFESGWTPPTSPEDSVVLCLPASLDHSESAQLDESSCPATPFQRRSLYEPSTPYKNPVGLRPRSSQGFRRRAHESLRTPRHRRTEALLPPATC